MNQKDDQGFLDRWSRRKRGSDALSSEDTASHPPTETHATAEPDAEAQRRLVESLPDVDSLTEESDFTAFLQQGVPDELRQRALRKLWRLNPVFANLDGLNDYDLDYTDAAAVVENLKTAYRAGKGYLTPQEADEAPSASAEARRDEAAATPAAPEAAERSQPHPRDTAPAGEDRATNRPSEGTADGNAASSWTQDDASDADAPAPPPRGTAARRRWGGGPA